MGASSRVRQRDFRKHDYVTNSDLVKALRKRAAEPAGSERARSPSQSSSGQIE
jgi:hypothetical protein